MLGLEVEAWKAIVHCVFVYTTADDFRIWHIYAPITLVMVGLELRRPVNMGLGLAPTSIRSILGGLARSSAHQTEMQRGLDAHNVQYSEARSLEDTCLYSMVLFSSGSEKGSVRASRRCSR